MKFCFERNFFEKKSFCAAFFHVCLVFVCLFSIAGQPKKKVSGFRREGRGAREIRKKERNFFVISPLTPFRPIIEAIRELIYELSKIIRGS